MKLSRFLLGTLACTMLAACSNEEASVNDNGTQTPTGSAYMAVNLIMSNGSSSRTASDGGFDNGTEDEGAVSISNSVFLFYDANGNYLTKGNIIGHENDGDTDNDGYLDLVAESDGNNIESKSNAVVVLGPTASIPTQVLAVLNGGADVLAGMSLSDAMAALTTGTIGTTKGNFLMTNSVYVADDQIITTTPISSDNLRESEDDAIAEGVPVDIYVERVAAKLTVKVDSSIEGENEEIGSVELKNDYVLDNVTGATMKVVIDGWCANAVNAQSYYVKNLEESWVGTAPFTNWTGTYRTFWAKDMNYTGEGTYPNGSTYSGLTYYSWNEATKKADETVYLYENTIDQTFANVDGGDNTNVTTALVAAHIEYKKADEENYTQGNIYRHNGVYYTEEGLKDVVVASCGYYWFYTDVDHNKNWVPLNADDVTITFTVPTAEDADVSDVTVDVSAITKPSSFPETAVLVEGDTSEKPVGMDAVMLALEESDYFTELIGYNNGMCYYQIPIEHLSSTAESPFYGVVRNHSYVLTISDITGIGGAIYDPDKKLPPIPGKDKNYYMAAKLNVLAWKVVNQSAVLQ